MNNKEITYVWCIAYIDKDYIGIIDEQLRRNRFEDISTYIPTVNILKKRFKGKNVFETVPLLFNYGFFKMPFVKACNEQFLSELKSRISAIYGWVKDPVSAISNSILTADNKSVRYPKVSLASDNEIAQLVRKAKTLSVFSEDVIKKISPGDFIDLQGYPFDNIPAEIISIDLVNKKVKVKLLLDTLMTEVKVNFENIFYTVYSDYDENLKQTSIEDIELLGGKCIDKIYAKIDIYDEG